MNETPASMTDLEAPGNGTGHGMDPPRPACLATPPKDRFVEIPPDGPPLLAVIVDAEEEFNWRTYSRDQTSVTNIRQQVVAQRLFEPFAVVPTYMVDYPVASQRDGIAPLAELLRDGRCAIGSQLHSWVTPPFDEDISARTSFAGNLPKALEFAKIRRLTMAIEDNFGIPSKAYRAGRYGMGPNTAEALLALGYEIDCSVLPWVDLNPRQGPDFSSFGTTPFWLDGNRSLLELPLTAGLVGLFGKLGLAAPLYPRIASPSAEKLRIPAILSRLHLLDRIPLTPEGTTLAEAQRVTRWLLAQGHRVFCVSYHSSSLVVGHTPYVQSQAELSRFLGWLQGYLEFFFGEIGGRAAVPDDIRALALASSKPPSNTL